MKFTVTIELEEGVTWKATVAEFPDVADFADTPLEAGTLALDSAISLTESQSDGEVKP
jgi:predicted RNase H-like HicB family nuclease